MTQVDKALMFAEAAHGNQLYGKYPYVYHLKKTIEVAKELGLNEDIQVACALHDTLEDTPATYLDLVKEFGTVVARMVYDVTDELGITREERKKKTYPKIKSNVSSMLVKLCDRIANVRESVGDIRNLTRYQSEHKDFIEIFIDSTHIPEIGEALGMYYETMKEAEA
jgi:(p)ppGpp synthase/HD superfamily hydrolase